MSEEEIIAITEKILAEKRIGVLEATETFYNAIQGILDLYNKEKEKVDRLQKELEQEKEKNVDLQNKVDVLLEDIDLSEDDMVIMNKIYFYNNYISKDKIKDKIKEYEERQKNTSNVNHIIICQHIISVLEELLEE